MKNSVIGVVALILITFCVPAGGTVVIEPANDFVTPTQFGFDLIINNPDGVSAQAFQTTITLSGPSLPTLDDTSSEAVDGDLDYWVYGNSAGAGAITLGIDAFQFGDGPDDGNAEPLLVDDIVARYVFDWDGSSAGLYEINIDLDVSNSFVLNENFSTESLEFTPGQYDGGSHNFFLSVPEPASLMLLALGGTVLLKNRKR